MTVGLVIVAHSAQLAAGVVELAGQMIQGKTPIAAAGGALDDIMNTSADKILEAIQSVDGPDGVLVLLDLGSAILSAEMALEMLSDEQRDRVRLSYAHLVEGAVAAALEASLGRTLVRVNFYETAPEIALPPNVGADVSRPPPMYRPETETPVGADVSRIPPIYRPQMAGEPWHGITTSAGVAVGPALLYSSGAITLSM